MNVTFILLLSNRLVERRDNQSGVSKVNQGKEGNLGKRLKNRYIWKKEYAGLLVSKHRNYLGVCFMQGSQDIDNKARS